MKTIASLILSLFFSVTVNAASVNLAWDASPSPEVNAYRIYWGLASKTYTNHIDVGNVLTATVTGLNIRTTYFFAATAVVLPENLESDFSNEVSYLVPPPKPLPPTLLKLLTSANGGAALLFNTSQGGNYFVEQSSDLKTWALIDSVTNAPGGDTKVALPNTQTNQLSFFRVQQQESTPTVALSRGAETGRVIYPPLPPPVIKLNRWQKMKLFFRYRPGHHPDEMKGAERLLKLK